MIYELLKKQVQQNTAFLNVYGRAKKQKKNEVTTNSFGTKLTKIIEFPLYDGIPLVPNANKKDLVFFERVGNVRDISDSYYSVLEEDFKVIVWLNKDTFDVAGKTYNGDIDIIVQELNRALITNKNSYILSIEFEDATDENVFSSYTFSDAEDAMTIEPFSAFELNYKIKYLASCNNLDSNIVVLNSECEPVGNQSNGKIYVGDTEVTIKNTTGETLYFESIPATQDKEFEIQNSIYRVYNPQGKLLAEGEIPAEGVEEITVSLGFDDLPRIVNTEDKDVGHENDVTWIVEDSTVIIKNTEDAELYSVDVPAEESREQVINDSQAIIKDSSGNILKSENILAEGFKDITIQDSSFTVKNSEDNVLNQSNILAQSTGDYTVKDSTFIVTNSANKELNRSNIKAEGAGSYEVKDSNIKIKDSADNLMTDVNLPAEQDIVGTVQDSIATIKDSAGNTLKSENILAEGSKDITIQNSEVTIKDATGAVITTSSVLAESSEEIEIGMQKAPLVLKFDTTITGDNEIILNFTGTALKQIKVFDESNTLVKELEDSGTIIIDDLPIGVYILEIYIESREMLLNNNAITNARQTLVEVMQWGDIVWGENLGFAFRRCENLVISARDRMLFRNVGNRGMDFAFERVKITNNNWLRYIPFNTFNNTYDARGLFSRANMPDEVILDFKGASGLQNVGSMLQRYQNRGGNMQTLHILNMGDTENASGDIISSVSGQYPNLKSLIFQNLQLSQNIKAWGEGDAEDYITFFENLGDRTGKEQRTITIRVEDWDKLDTTQKDYVDNILNNRNWALAH